VEFFEDTPEAIMSFDELSLEDKEILPDSNHGRSRAASITLALAHVDEDLELSRQAPSVERAMVQESNLRAERSDMRMSSHITMSYDNTQPPNWLVECPLVPISVVPPRSHLRPGLFEHVIRLSVMLATRLNTLLAVEESTSETSSQASFANRHAKRHDDTATLLSRLALLHHEGSHWNRRNHIRVVEDAPIEARLFAPEQLDWALQAISDQSPDSHVITFLRAFDVFLRYSHPEDDAARDLVITLKGSEDTEAQSHARAAKKHKERSSSGASKSTVIERAASACIADPCLSWDFLPVWIYEELRELLGLEQRLSQQVYIGKHSVRSSLLIALEESSKALRVEIRSSQMDYVREAAILASRAAVASGLAYALSAQLDVFVSALSSLPQPSMKLVSNEVAQATKSSAVSALMTGLRIMITHRLQSTMDTLTMCQNRIRMEVVNQILHLIPAPRNNTAGSQTSGLGDQSPGEVQCIPQLPYLLDPWKRNGPIAVTPGLVLSDMSMKWARFESLFVQNLSSRKPPWTRILEAHQRNLAERRSSSVDVAFLKNVVEYKWIHIAKSYAVISYYGGSAATAPTSSSSASTSISSNLGLQESVVLSSSIQDVENLTFTFKAIVFENKRWTLTKLGKHLKEAMMKVVWDQIGATMTQFLMYKFGVNLAKSPEDSRDRPNTTFGSVGVIPSSSPQRVIHPPNLTPTSRVDITLSGSLDSLGRQVPAHRSLVPQAMSNPQPTASSSTAAPDQSADATDEDASTTPVLQFTHVLLDETSAKPKRS